jgi:site-specific DNA recombinase
MTRAIIYRRQSRDKLNDELGIERQLKECNRVAKSRGFSVVDTITDNDISASKRGRPGYGRLLSLMGTGAVDVVIILRIDRLLRLNDELEELIQLVEKHPVKVVTAEGEIDLSTPQGRLMARILVSVARSEMEVKSSRHKLANKQKAEAGKPHGSRRTFGYEADNLTIREDEALVLKDIAHRFLNGSSYRRLSDYLNERGIRTAEGCEFFPITIRNMLIRKRYAGIREYQAVEYRGSWPPIFDEEMWARIQHKARQRRNDAGNLPVAKKYLLTGFLVCGGCGSQLNGATKRDNPTRPLRNTYHCKDKHCVTRNAPALEHFIRELIVYRLDSPVMNDLVKASERGSGSELLSRREGLKAKLDNLLDDYSDGTLTKAEYTRARSRVQTQLQRVDGQIADYFASDALDGLLGASESIRERWIAEDNAWRRQVIGLLLKRVVVHPGITKPYYIADGVRYRFDPELIDVQWRA